METRRLRKEKIGIVVSNKMDKSIVVEVERKVKHPKYGKYVKKTSRFMANDVTNTCSEGDKVRIEETRPMSKLKTWKVIERVQAGKTAAVEADV